MLRDGTVYLRSNRIRLKFELIQGIMDVLVLVKNGDLKKMRKSVDNTINFSDNQGQLTPQSFSRSDQNAFSTEILWLSLFLPSDENCVIFECATVLTLLHTNFSSIQGQLTPKSEVGSGRN